MHPNMDIFLNENNMSEGSMRKKKPKPSEIFNMDLLMSKKF